MATVTCEGCGKAIPVNSRYCIHCGAVIDMDALINPQGKIVLPAMPARVVIKEQPRREIKTRDTRKPDDVDSGKKALMYTKSFVGLSFLTWAMYYVGVYIIGLIMNLSYLSEAKKIQKYTGRPPEGMGCLQILLFIHFYIPIIIVILTIISGGLFLDWLMDTLGF